MKLLCGTSGMSDDGSPSTRCLQTAQGTCNDCAEEADILGRLDPDN